LEEIVWRRNGHLGGRECGRDRRGSSEKVLRGRCCCHKG
jgi:hypothetical protein